jgi:hypothetical protein
VVSSMKWLGLSKKALQGSSTIAILPEGTNV